MELTRPSRPVWRLFVLPLVLALGSLPAAAQSGSEAVVCVGSERRTLATNPIRRVYTEDMEIVYRIGADIGQRDQVERDLSSDLGSYPEVWCAWSDPGDRPCRDRQLHGRHPPGSDRGPGGPEVPGLQRGLRHGLRCGRNPGDDDQPALQQPERRQRIRGAAERDVECGRGGPGGGRCGERSSACRKGRSVRVESPPRAVGRESPTILDVTCGIPDRRKGLARTGAVSVQPVSPKGGEESGGNGTMEALLRPDCFRLGGARGSTSSTGERA